MHECGGRWVGSNKLVELKKKKERKPRIINGETIASSINIAGKPDIHMQKYENGYLYVILLTKITQRVLMT